MWSLECVDSELLHPLSFLMPLFTLWLSLWQEFLRPPPECVERYNTCGDLELIHG